MLSSLSNQSVVFRTDTHSTIGIGHLMRCLALAQAIKDAGGQAVLVTSPLPTFIESRWKTEGVEIRQIQSNPGSEEDAIELSKIAKTKNASWVVVDGYHFGGNYQKKLKDSDLRLLAVDDYSHAHYYYADIILNQNLHAHQVPYLNKQPYTQTLRGTNYVLLRREFLKWKGQKKNTQKISRILVTMGGSDVKNLTLKALKGLQQANIGFLQAVALIDKNNKFQKELDQFSQTNKNFCRVENDAEDFSQLMAWADLAISAGGSTCWEMAFMGLPNLILVLAENQKEVARHLEKIGASINLGPAHLVSSEEITNKIKGLLQNPSRLQEMSHRGQQLIDGEGALRVLMKMYGLTLRLSQVNNSHCELLWKWANDPATREMSLTQNNIPWSDHQKWLAQKLESKNTYFYIGVDQDEVPVGQIRLEVTKQHEAEVNISVDPNQRGKGYGTQMITLATENLNKTKSIETFYAYVKPANQTSMTMFKKSGFENMGFTSIRDIEVYRYQLRKTTNAQYH